MKRKRFVFDYPPGATPLDPNETEGLLADFISTQSELNQLEQENILEAKTWATRSKKYKGELTDAIVRDLHRRMFKNVWKWAGQYRHSDKSIGVAWQQIPTELAKLLHDTKFWIEKGTYPWDELGVRFHHRLVSIHVFANGNGRHARLLTDVLLESRGQKPFSWGASLADAEASPLATESVARTRYLEALREADRKRWKPLLQFVRL